jgi:predicted NBD/HSP70 family sugar kinase
MDGKMFVSLDVGGNSIKGAVVSDGKVIVVKEYRWYPTGLKTADEMNNPQIFMLRFLINYAMAIFSGSSYEEHESVVEAMCCNASYSCIEKANQYFESMGLSPYHKADAIVIGFPDIVVLNKIAGGESYKHRGMKNNLEIDYESEFFKTSDLDEKVKVFAKKDHPVIILNDGNTASFLISVEQACQKGSLLKENGMFANTVGTEFGTGFISRGGTIQYIPMEGFQHIIDLGNTDYSKYDGNDVRSTRNMNTGIPGTIQKYVSQLGLFRMAMSAFCEKDWPTVQRCIDKGLFTYDKEKDFLQVVTEPASSRDTITRILVDEMLENGNTVIEEVFKSMGKALGVLIDQDKLIFPEVEGTRLLSGGIVACDTAFSIISDALGEHNNEYKVVRLDESSACIPLLRSIPIDKRSFTVAIGSAFIGNRFLIEHNYFQENIYD